MSAQTFSLLLCNILRLRIVLYLVIEDVSRKAKLSLHGWPRSRKETMVEYLRQRTAAKSRGFAAVAGLS